MVSPRKPAKRSGGVAGEEAVAVAVAVPGSLRLWDRRSPTVTPWRSTSASAGKPTE